MADQPKPHSIRFSIPLASHEHATIVRRALQVDRERHPAEVRVTMDDSVGSALAVTIETTTLRLLRMNVNSLFENLDLVVRTIDGLTFGADAPTVVGLPPVAAATAAAAS